MNIKITEEEAKELFKREVTRIVMGSQLYGLNNENSDLDYLVLYEAFDKEINLLFQIRHQFQWFDEQANIEYIFCTREQFVVNAFSGESTINVDIALFTDRVCKTEEEKLQSCRTYNIIKAYLGLAKRDIKYNRNNNKYKHIVRGLYTASCLLDNKMPSLKEMKNICLKEPFSTNDELKSWQNELRLKCNKMYEKDELKMYPISILTKEEIEYTHPLQIKLIESCNTKEFKYDSN